MDQAGGIAGVDRAQGRVVTVAVDAMHFISPMRVGDVLCVYTQVERVGRTSMTVRVEASELHVCSAAVAGANLFIGLPCAFSVSLR
jgi:acyl-CoA thioesterase YciA